MRLNTIILSVIFLIIAPQLSHSETVNLFLPDYNFCKYGPLCVSAEMINPDLLKQEKETESPVRRFEVTFFISLPFIFIVDFAALHSYEVIRQKSFNVNVWKEHKKLLIAGTLAITAAISFREAYISTGSMQKEASSGEGERFFFFCAARNY